MEGGRTYGNSPLCPTGHRPFGAAAQKGKKLWLKVEAIKPLFKGREEEEGAGEMWCGKRKGNRGRKEGKVNEGRTEEQR